MKNMLKLGVAVVLCLSAVVALRASDDAEICGTCGCDKILFSPSNHNPLCGPTGSPPEYFVCNTSGSPTHHCSNFIG